MRCRYKPLDFLCQPQSVSSFPEAVSVLRECDMLCTMTSAQSHSVLNTKLLIVALIQHTFTVLLPLPKPRKAEHASESESKCLWRTPMLCAQLSIRPLRLFPSPGRCVPS